MREVFCKASFFFLVLFLNFACASISKEAALEDARNSYIQLLHWKFNTDPQELGVIQGWDNIQFDDTRWKTIQANEVWEKQGFETYNGKAWYRTKVWIPKDWKNSVIRFENDGAGDEYDVYLNGEWIKHLGGADFGSVFAWPTHAELQSKIKYGAWNTIAIRVTDLGWSEGGGLWRRTALRRIVPLEKVASLLPEPVLEAHPEWINLYWRVWQLLWQGMSFGNSQNKFSKAFLEEAFNEQVYQWDSCFISIFAKYGMSLFPALSALDNFYLKQKEDGYIQRSYSVTTGEMAEVPSSLEPAVNPPLFSWVELEYANYSGDLSRLKKYFSHWERYFYWIKKNMRGPLGQGLYYQTQIGSGMDNTPRGDANEAGWVDMSFQQALAAQSLEKIAVLLGKKDKAKIWNAEFLELKKVLNEKLWYQNPLIEKDAFYSDLQRNGEAAKVKHLGAYWSLLTNVPSPEQASKMVAHLKNEKEFKVKNLFPTLSYSDPDYSVSGRYWRGSVWAPTNYVVLKGLQQWGDSEFAFDAAKNYLGLLTRVYHSNLDSSRITALDRSEEGFLHTLWECYAPESDLPCSPNESGSFARGNFVGWSGLGPVAILIENIIGLKINGLENKVTWELREKGKVGLKNFSLADKKITLIADASSGKAQRRLSVTSEKAFLLEVITKSSQQDFKVKAGTQQFYIKE